MKVIFDTSFIIYLLEKPSNVLERIVDEIGMPEITVPKSVIVELERLSRKKKIIKNYKLLRIESFEELNKNADEDILKLALKTRYPVFTLDLELARKLSELGLPCYTLSNNKVVSCGTNKR
ncbi:MAG: hypothetical protein RXO71_01850 [Nitrososphaeria archaeon]|jgi:rRNA-processing protein FCF1